MTRAIALCVSACLLTSCATPSTPPVEQPKPKAVDPRLCAPVRKTPETPKDASLVQPVTDEEKAGFAAFLSYVADLFDAATENERRATLAKDRACRP